ncbi:MAG: T9SS type A sorting domain-containing protein, partial [bacterium]|nr:T9SS type A sorting domain-containing protein [bacterium]
NTSVDASCTMVYNTVKFSTRGIESENAGPTINNCTITDNRYGVTITGNSTTHLWNSAVNNSQYTPIWMSMASDPDFINLSFNGNGYTGLGIYEGSLSGVGRLKRRNVAGITAISYINTSAVTIETNGNLVIDPGVTVKFTDVWSPWTINGKLKSLGKAPADSQVVFTSIHDDSRGGDNNNNGNESTPDPMNWSFIQFTDASNDTACVMRNTQFRYGGYWWSSWDTDGPAAVWLVNASPTIDSCLFMFQPHAISIQGNSAPTITWTTIQNNSATPITMDLQANPSISNMSWFNIGLAGLGLRTQNITSNFTWPQRNIAGYTNVTWVLEGNFTVASGATLIVPAGTVVKSWQYGMFVNGAMQVNGTTGSRAVFTSTHDDAYGNPTDTDQNGSATVPIGSDWAGIDFNDISVDANCWVNYARVNYATAGVAWNNAASSTNNSIFVGNVHGVQCNGASQPTISNFTIQNSEQSPISMSLASNPTFTGGTLSNNTFHAIQLQQETTAADYTLLKRNIAGDVNIPYLLNDAQLTVGTNSILTINPGVVVKLRNSTIVVQKGLMALGGSLPDSQIVFTSYRDDFYGGDTNNDGDVSSASAGDWGWIQFDDTSIDPQCRMDFCVIRYGHVWNQDNYGLVRTVNASPTIRYTMFSDAYNAMATVGASNPVLSNCGFYNISNYGLQNSGSFNINAQNCWWGSNTGPYNAASNPAGLGCDVTSNVNYSPFLSSWYNYTLLGDVSLNSVITAYDASMILRYLVNPVTFPLNTHQQRVANTSGDASITSLDASYILQYTAGLLATFPGETTSLPGGDNPSTPTPTNPVVASLSEQSFRFGNVQFAQDETTSRIPVFANSPVEVFAGQMVLSLPSGMKLDSFTPADGWLSIMNPIASGYFLGFAGSASANQHEPIGWLIVSRNAGQMVQGTIALEHGILNETPAVLDAGGSIASEALPQSFALLSNYPNPFNPSTTIPFALPTTSNVRIAVYDATGRMVVELANREYRAGHHSISWDGKNIAGLSVSTGTYFVRLEAGAFRQVRSMQFVR